MLFHAKNAYIASMYLQCHILVNTISLDADTARQSS